MALWSSNVSSFCLSKRFSALERVWILFKILSTCVMTVNCNVNLKGGVAGSLQIDVFIVTMFTTSSAFLQAKGIVEYVKASKARIAEYEQQVSMDVAL